MIIMISGSSGHIGSNLIKRLYKYKSFSFVLLNNKKKNYFFRTNTRVKNFYMPLSADIKYLKNINIDFKKIDVFIHLAWPSLNDYYSDDHYKLGYLGSKRILKFMVKRRLQNIIITGTCFEYGNTITGPVMEKMLDQTVNNSYSKSKKLLRSWLINNASKYRFKFNWLIIFYLIDKNINFNDNLISNSIYFLKQKKTFYIQKPYFAHDFIKIETIVNKIVKVIISQKYVGIINIGSGNITNVKKLINKYINKNKINSFIKFSEIYDKNNYFWSNNTKYNKYFIK